MHIDSTDINELKKLTNDKEFTYRWYINHDVVKVCKDCEYRYICIDSRKLIKEGDLWIAEKECNYNPYISKWEGEEGYITIEEWQKQNPYWERQAKEQRQIRY